MPLPRLLTYLLLIVALLWPGYSWAIAGASGADMEAGNRVTMPCGAGMPMASHHHAAPDAPGCCPHASCDLSACIATGCLPRVATMPPVSSAIGFAVPCRLGVAPDRVPERLLRPPIA